MRLLLILSVWILSSCSANYYLKRSQQLERKAIELGAVVKHDTVFVDREVIVPERHIDTVVHHVNFRDTITVTQNHVVTRVKIDTVHHTVYVKTTCPKQIKIIQVPVKVVKTIQTSGGVPWWIWVIIGVMGLLIVVLVFKK